MCTFKTRQQQIQYLAFFVESWTSQISSKAPKMAELVVPDLFVIEILSSSLFAIPSLEPEASDL